MKIGQLYDLDRFKAFADSSKAAGFKDSSTGVILARNLTAVNPKVFEKKYPELSFVNSGIMVDNTGGYSRRIQSLRVIEQGDFADSSDLNSGKGRISLSAEDSFIKVFPKEAHSLWTDDDVKEADLQNIHFYKLSHNICMFIGFHSCDGGSWLERHVFNTRIPLTFDWAHNKICTSSAHCVFIVARLCCIVNSHVYGLCQQKRQQGVFSGDWCLKSM